MGGVSGTLVSTGLRTPRAARSGGDVVHTNANAVEKVAFVVFQIRFGTRPF